MAIAVQTDASLVKPLEGAIVRRYTAAAAITAGQPVAVTSAGKVDLADGDSSDPVADFVTGVAVQTAAANERVDVVVFGPISAITGATIGAKVYISDTAGTPDQSSTSNGVIGWAESATVLFVNP